RCLVLSAGAPPRSTTDSQSHAARIPPGCGRTARYGAALSPVWSGEAAGEADGAALPLAPGLALGPALPLGPGLKLGAAVAGGAVLTGVNAPRWPKPIANAKISAKTRIVPATNTADAGSLMRSAGSIGKVVRAAF